MECSSCKPRIFPSTAHFKSTDFSCDFKDPQILPIAVEMTDNGLDGYLFNVTIGGTGNTFNYKVILNNLTLVGNIINNSCQEISGVGTNSTVSAQKIVLRGNPNCNPTPSSYVNEDTYIIDVLASCGIKVSFSRFLGFTLSYPEINSCKDCKCLQGDVEVPQIFIEAQTTIDGSDISNAIFKICDKYTYYEEKRLCSTKCKTELIPSSKIKETLFNRYCPIIGPVLKGKGKNAQEKVTYLASINNIDNSSDFYHNIVLYAMVRYVLSRILYGTFDTKYLLNKYNKKFLENLKHSRFCKFLEFFSLYPNYHNYFKWE
jgi:hypothetical protein